MHPLRNTAYDWHGSQDSPLYSFASTGGIVHTEEHRERLLAEIAECSSYVGNDDPELDRLLAHVEQAEIGVALEDYAQ